MKDEYTVVGTWKEKKFMVYNNKQKLEELKAEYRDILDILDDIIIIGK